jgi:hypothetical protein
MFSRSKWLLDRRHIIDKPSLRSNVKVGQYGTIFLKFYNSTPLDFYPTVLIEKYTVRALDFPDWRANYNGWYREEQYVVRNFRHCTGELVGQLGADGETVIRARYVYASIEKVVANNYVLVNDTIYPVLYDRDPYLIAAEEKTEYREKQIVNWKTEGF